MDTKETEDFPEALDEDLMKRTFEAALQDDVLYKRRFGSNL